MSAASLLIQFVPITLELCTSRAVSSLLVPQLNQLYPALPEFIVTHIEPSALQWLPAVNLKATGLAFKSQPLSVSSYICDFCRFIISTSLLPMWISLVLQNLTLTIHWFILPPPFFGDHSLYYFNSSQNALYSDLPDIIVNLSIY